MIHDRIDKMIMGAIAAAANDPAKKFEMETLRLVKAEFMKYDASKEAVSKPMDENIETGILKRMVKQRRESTELYAKGGRPELAERENREAGFIEGFLPEPVGEDDIRREAEAAIASGIEPVRKNMGAIIKAVKSKYPAADGKTVSAIVSGMLK